MGWRMDSQKLHCGESGDKEAAADVQSWDQREFPGVQRAVLVADGLVVRTMDCVSFEPVERSSGHVDRSCRKIVMVAAIVKSRHFETVLLPEQVGQHCG